ncbi:hypothetical protein [Xenorhabdus cabanillasii]|uniref:hypothetical protein n=1 Tax=Xenorhabdus cabanillasii TaxID=351673 RepID=UPI001E4B15E6|nr:hypothetical protein [Xenorhabdus cabanillasii]
MLLLVKPFQLLLLLLQGLGGAVDIPVKLPLGLTQIAGGDPAGAQYLPLALQRLAQMLGFVFQLTGCPHRLLQFPALGLCRITAGINNPA